MEWETIVDALRTALNTLTIAGMAAIIWYWMGGDERRNEESLGDRGYEQLFEDKKVETEER